MAPYVVIAPLAILKDETGTPVYRYQGAVVDLDGRSKATKRLVDLELVAEVDLSDLVVGLGEHVVDPELTEHDGGSDGGSDGDADHGDSGFVVDFTKLKGERPPLAASKEAWVDYAELNGLLRADAEKLGKAHLQSVFTAPE